MLKSAELKQKRQAKKADKRKLAEKLQGLITSAESRQLTDEEKAALDQVKQDIAMLNSDIESLDTLIEEAEEMEADDRANAEEEARKSKRTQGAPVDMSVQDLSDDERRAIAAFSIAKAMRQAANGPINLDGVEKEMHQEGVRELRAANIPVGGAGVIVPMMVLRNKDFAATAKYMNNRDRRSMSVTGGSGGNKGGLFVQEELIDYVELLKSKTPLFSQYGVRMVTGLQGDLPLVRQSAAVQFGWKGETADADATDMTLAEYVMKPNRLTGQITVSDRLINQSSLDIEALLNADIISSHAVVLQQAIINGAGSGSKQPLGLLNDADVIAKVLGANGGTLTWEKVLELIQALDDENHLMDDPRFLMATNLRTVLKTADIDSGSGLKVWDLQTGTIDGYFADTSNIVPKNLTKGTGIDLSAILFGNWQDYIVGQWGGFEIVYDPYTKAKSGEKVWTLNVFHDGVARRPKSFAYYKDVITSASGTASASV